MWSNVRSSSENAVENRHRNVIRNMLHECPLPTFVITNDGGLLDLLGRQPAPNLRLMWLPEFVEMIAKMRVSFQGFFGVSEQFINL